MNDERDMTRRQMLRGGFLRSFKSAADRALDALNADEPQPPNHSMKRDQAFVARYPKNVDDVDKERGSRRWATIPVLRPPGAIEERAFLNECTRCDECIKACPHDSIIHAPLRFREAAGTPMIDPVNQPCWLCEDRPCIEACEPGVLTHAIETLMGTARINEETCLAHNNTMCTVCSERCPVEGAIALDERGRPTVVEKSCTGCGVCQYVCPAPENAVLIMPTFARPPRPDGAVQKRSIHGD